VSFSCNRRDCSNFNFVTDDIQNYPPLLLTTSSVLFIAKRYSNARRNFAAPRLENIEFMNASRNSYVDKAAIMSTDLAPLNMAIIKYEVSHSINNRD
jgi:hypothetical protein